MDFGFVFCRFIRFYHFTDEYALNIPVRRFWFMNAQIERVTAYEMLTQIQLHQSSASGEHAQQLAEQLKEQMGSVSDVRPVEFVTTDEANKEALSQISGKTR